MHVNVSIIYPVPLNGFAPQQRLSLRIDLLAMIPPVSEAAEKREREKKQPKNRGRVSFPWAIDFWLARPRPISRWRARCVQFNADSSEGKKKKEVETPQQKLDELLNDILLATWRCGPWASRLATPTGSSNSSGSWNVIALGFIGGHFGRRFPASKSYSLSAPLLFFFVFFFIPIPKTENTPKKNAPGPPPTQLQSHVLFNTFFENKKVKEKETEPELDISVGVYRVFLTGFPEVGRRKWQLIGRHVVRFLLFLVSE